ncbi:hypothetical protein P3T22_000162 [Paraburkholderia sp. GAS348]
MTKLFFERIEDMNVDRPYLFVFLLEDDQTYWVGKFTQFLEIFIQPNNELEFVLCPTHDTVRLTKLQWQEIMDKSHKFLEFVLERGDD